MNEAYLEALEAVPKWYLDEYLPVHETGDALNMLLGSDCDRLRDLFPASIGFQMNPPLTDLDP